MRFNKNKYLKDMEQTDVERIRSEQISIAFRQAFASIFPLFLGALIISFLYWDTSLRSYVNVWFVIMNATLLWRLWLLMLHKKHPKKYSDFVWEYHFKVVMYLTALLWGISAFFLFQSNNLTDQFAIIFILSGMASVASGTLASMFGLSVVFLSFLIMPLFIVIVLHGGLEYQMMGFLVAAFYILLVNASRRIHLNILSALKSKILHEKAAEALELSEEQFEIIFKEAPAGIFYYNKDLIVIESNVEMMQILQITRDEMIGLDLKKLPDRSLYDAIFEPISGNKGYYEGSYVTMIHNLQLWITLRTSPIYNAKREIIGGVALVTDITERIHAEEKIKHQAYYDALTDIPNRILLKDRLAQSLAHYRRSKNIVAVMFLDLDHFKSINDSLGHHIGDALLVETAKRLKKICR